MAIVHVINIHNHPIKFQGCKMKLPIGFDGYIDDETGEIVETNLAETYVTKTEVEKLKKDLNDDNEKKSKKDNETTEKLEKEIQALKDSRSYSTEEVNTGKTWIDGKPIYRKTYYSATNWPNNTLIDTIANLGTVIQIRDICADNGYYVQNFGANTGSTQQLTIVNKNTGKVLVYRSGGYANNTPSTVIIEYTKTTD